MNAAVTKPAQDPGVDPALFRQALGSFPSGVTIVTAWSAGGAPTGTTVSAFSALSLSPPLVLVCLDRESRTLDAVRRSGCFGVNILSTSQAELALRFAKSGAVDRFADLEPGAACAPFIKDCAATLSCSLADVVDGGDHAVLIGQVDAAEADQSRTPLVYLRGRFVGAD